jgi:cation diffusion facilitator CzcD-associated flavoprotein CzcO
MTDPIERITETGIATRDGRERRLDTLILATGFATTKFLSAIDVVGRGGVAIADAWSQGAQAYKASRRRASRTSSCSTGRTPTPTRSSR